MNTENASVRPGAAAIGRRAGTAMSSIPRRELCGLALAVLVLHPSDARAVRFDYQIEAGLAHSDNIGLSESDRVEDTAASLRLSLDASQSGSRVVLQARGSVQYLGYLDDTFDDELRGEFAGRLNWTLLPERIEWRFEDYLGRQPIDVRGGFSPDNQEQVNVFVTGPSLVGRFGPRTRGRLDLRYGNTYAEENRDFNSDRFSATATVLRDFGPTARVAASVEAARVDFDRGPPGTDADYDRLDVYLSHQRELRDIDLRADLGVSSVDFADRPGGRRGEPLLRGSVDWRLSSRGQLSVDVGYQFSDAAQDLVGRAQALSGPLVEDLSGARLQAVPDVFRDRRVNLGYRRTGDRLTWLVRTFYQRIDYDDDVIGDQSNRGGGVRADYRLRERLTLSLGIDADRRRFEIGSRRDNDLRGFAALSQTLARHWSWRVEYQYRERDSDALGADYRENVVAVALSYRR